MNADVTVALQRRISQKGRSGSAKPRRRAFSHSLAPETVINLLERGDDYRRFEASIISDFAPRSAVERELISRVASLIWRLRRVTAIETGLAQIQSNIQREQRLSSAYSNEHSTMPGLPPHKRANGHGRSNIEIADDRTTSVRLVSLDGAGRLFLTHYFLRLLNLDNAIFDRLGRYEAHLARELSRTLFLLDAAGRKISPRIPHR